MTQNIEERTLAATATMEGAAKAVDEIANTDKDVSTPVGSRKSFPKISREWDEESTRLKDEWGSESQRLQNEWNNDSATLRQDWQNERNELSTKALGVKPWESGVSESNVNQQRRWTDNHTYLPKTVPAVMTAEGPDDSWIPYTADKSDTLNDVFGRKPIDLVIGIILVPDAKFNYPKLYALGKVWELDDGDQHLTVKDFSETADEHLIITLDDDSLIIAGKVVAASRNYVNELTGIRQKALSGGTKQLDLKRGQYGQQADGVDRVSLDNDTYWFAWDSPSGVVRNFVVNNDYGTATMECELDDASIAYFEFVSPTIDKLREQGDIRGFGAIFGGEEYCDDAIAKAFENSVKTGRIVAPKGYVARCANAILHTFSATDRVDVSLECSFIFESQDGFDIRGLQNSEFKLGLVSYLSLDTNDSEVSPGCGIAISSFWSTKVDIQESRNFLVGNKLIGGNLTSGSGNGMAFNDILIRNAKAPRVSGGVGCLVTTVPVGSKPGYFNENKLKLGFLRGERGVFFKKGDLQTDPFNGNKLLYPQIELAEKTGIELEFCRSNTILFPRFEGSGEPLDYWINEHEDCSRNDFYLTGPAKDSKFRFAGKMTNRHGRINDDDGGFVADAKYGGVDNTDETGNNNDLYIAHRRTSKTPNNTIFFGGLLSAIGGLGRWARYAGGVKDRNGVEKVFGLLDPYGEYSPVGESGLLMVPTGVSWINVETSSGAIILKMNNDREINGYSMYLNIYFFQESIEIMKSTGTTTIPSSQIVEDGLYMLAYNSDGWRVSRIGDSCK